MCLTFSEMQIRNSRARKKTKINGSFDRNGISHLRRKWRKIGFFQWNAKKTSRMNFGFDLFSGLVGFKIVNNTNNFHDWFDWRLYECLCACVSNKSTVFIWLIRKPNGRPNVYTTIQIFAYFQFENRISSRPILFLRFNVNQCFLFVHRFYILLFSPSSLDLPLSLPHQRDDEVHQSRLKFSHLSHLFRRK